MTDLLIPELLASPDPATVNFVPLYNLIGAAALQSGPSCRVYNSANISLPSGSFGTMTWDSERFDTDGIHDTATNTSRLTCRTAGVYQISGNIEYASGAGTKRVAAIRLNGVDYIARTDAVPVSGAVSIIQVTTAWQLNPGDYVELMVFQDSGGAINILADPKLAPEFEMVFIGGPQGPPGPAGAGTPGYGTSLPGSPADGQEYVLVDSVSNPSYQWRFRYNAGSSSAYKWEFVGGSQVHNYSGGQQNLGSANVWGGGLAPTITVPRAGEYHVQVKADGYGASSTGTPQVYLNMDRSGSANNPLGGVSGQATIGGSGYATGLVSLGLVTLGAGETVRLAAYPTGTGLALLNASMTLMPKRVS